MSIDLDFMYDSNDLIKTYVLDSGGETDTYSMQPSKAIPKGLETGFPYNRRTIKLG